MTIEINRPEIEALIQQRLQRGGFKDPQDVILHALRASERQEQPPTNTGSKFANLSDLLLGSPFAGAGLDLERSRDYPRSIVIE